MELLTATPENVQEEQQHARQDRYEQGITDVGVDRQAAAGPEDDDSKSL